MGNIEGSPQLLLGRRGIWAGKPRKVGKAARDTVGQTLAADEKPPELEPGGEGGPRFLYQLLKKWHQLGSDWEDCRSPFVRRDFGTL